MFDVYSLAIENKKITIKDRKQIANFKDGLTGLSKNSGLPVLIVPYGSAPDTHFSKILDYEKFIKTFRITHSKGFFIKMKGSENPGYKDYRTLAHILSFNTLYITADYTGDPVYKGDILKNINSDINSKKSLYIILAQNNLENTQKKKTGNTQPVVTENIFTKLNSESPDRKAVIDRIKKNRRCKG